MTVINNIEIDYIDYKRNIIKDAIQNNDTIEDKLNVIIVESNPCQYSRLSADAECSGGPVGNTMAFPAQHSQDVCSGPDYSGQPQHNAWCSHHNTRHLRQPRIRQRQ